MRINYEEKLDYSDVLIVPKRSTLVSRQDVDLTRALKFKWSPNPWVGVPIIAANMDTVGTFRMAEELANQNVMTALHKYYTIDQLVKWFAVNKNINDLVFYTLGITNSDLRKWETVYKDLKDLAPGNVCIDVANGYTENFVEFIKRFREKYPHVRIMAGNVVTAEMTEQLILSGADIAKVGIGPGSVCTTRKIAGVGHPQLSAVMECSDAAHGLGGWICADGGLTVPGDFGKAYGAGADFTMAGGMFAGHDECDGKIIEKTIRTNEVILHKTGAGQLVREDSVYRTEKYMEFYGMSSDSAMEKYAGGLADYRASEGKTVLVPYRGKVIDTVREILGGIRSTCTYVGARRLKELHKRTTFIRANRQLNTVYGE